LISLFTRSFPKDPRDFKEGAALVVRSGQDVDGFALPLQKIFQDLDRDLPVNRGGLVRLFDWDH
jgi:hypothetical protein